ncbi:nucleotide exchange factor GrpE [Cohnella sp.]|uniref:nucleotide exchange factor GrpE n=1 Tax=Cohnella sp. TaxID=1883426 RepID=UPI00356758E0
MKEQDTMEQQEQANGEQENITNTNDTTPLEGEAAAEAVDENNVITALQQQSDENHNRYLRAQADFDNFRRRTIKEKEELMQYASLKLVSQLLPVLDNFQRALQTSTEAVEGGAFAKGVDMIYRQLFQVLEAEGLKQMDVVGQPFDPEWHQAVMQVESDEYAEGIVVEAIQPGYVLKDKVIRPAMVKVSQ